MFSPACLSLSPLKLVGHKTSGSYDIDQLPADGLDQNLNKVDENNNNSSSSSSNNNNNNNNNGQLDPSTLVPANQHFQTSQRDFNQNQARRLKKLRSISFSRFVYLKSHYSYDLPRQLTELKSPQTSQYTEIESKSIKSKLLPNNNNNLNDQKDGVTLCSLGVGTTFGASVMPGKSHSVSVVTNEECTLLRVRRADFQEIFNGQSHLINDLEASPFLPFGSLHGHNNNKQQAGDLGALTRIRSSISSSLSKFAPGGRHSQSACHGQSGRQGRAQTPVARDAANPAGSYQRRRSSLISGAAQSGAPEQPQPASRRQSVTMSSRQAYELADSAQSTRATPRSIPYGGHQAAASQQPQQVASYSVEEAPHKRDTGGGDLESQEHEPNEDAADQTQAELEAEDLNLDSLEADELTSHLMKVGWVLRTLILSEAAHMIKSRRVYPQLHHALLTSHSANVSTAAPHQSSSNIAGAKLSNKQQRQQQPTPSQGSQPAAPSRSSALRTSMGRHLVSMGSSSQLFLSSTASSASSSTKSVASSAGRKVANYVASSFMRTSGGGGGGGGSGGSPSSQQIPTIGATSTTPTGHSNLSVLLLSSKQTVPTDQPTGGRHPDSKLHHFSSLDQNNNNNNNNTNVISQPVSEHKSKAQVANHHHHHHHSLHEHQEQPVQLEHSLVGREMVDWLLQLSSGANTNAGRFVGSRLQAVSMWQVLLEQEAILSVPLAPGSGSSGGGKTSAKPESYQKHQQQQQQQQSQRQAAHQFRDDSHAYYKFWFDCESDLEGSQEDQQASREQKPEAPATSRPPLPRPRDSEEALANEALWWSLKLLSKLAPDACFRLILGKQPHERTLEEVDIVFEELQHLKALSHLTNSVKKQLAACVQSEHHARQNTVVFNQGDPGQSWYIILRGSVNVVIVGKGVVCTLHDGDDFGKLALVNDAPRAATIVTNEPNCYFLRVDKRDFNTILRDVEANTVRLKEHGKEVLILQKVAIKEQQLSTPEQLQQQQQQQAEQQQQQGQSQLGSSSEMIAAQTAVLDGGGQPGGGPSASGAGSAAAPTASQLQQAGACALKYMVMAGTAEKMLEHLLETRIDGQTQTAPLPLAKAALFQHDQMANYIQCHGDNFLEDFILTHKIFMPTGNLCQELLRQYQQSGQAAGSSSSNSKASTPTPPTSSGGGPGQANAATSKQQPALDDEYLVAKKRRVIKFVRFWMLINREHFFQQQQIQTFVMTLHQRVKLDAQRFSSLQPELKAISRIYELQLEENLESRHRGCQRWIEDVYGNILPIRRHSGSWQAPTSSGGGGGGQTGTSLPASSNPTNEQQQMAASEHFLASLHQRRFQHKLSTIQPEDELVFRVYCADHTFTTLKCRFDEQAGQIKQVAARNLKLEDKELILVHVKSNGERIIYNDLETNICTCLSVNGRLFVCPLDHIDAISPLPEQDPFQEVYQSLASIKQQQTSLDGAENTSGGQVGAALAGNAQQQQQQQQQPPHQSPLANSNLSSASQQSQTQSQPDLQPISSHLLVSTPSSFSDIKLQMSLSVSKLEEFSSRDIAYCLTQLAWSLLKNMHEFELVYTVFGQHNFKQNTANLNVFLRHFNEIQYWVVTQICLSSSLSKRVQILRKFIKIAAHCKELQNLNAFFAIIMGLSNMAVARLTQTWERLPNKLKRTFSQFESQIDPSRNHRRYRIFLSKLEPPIVPFMPLFLKDMTFAHEGNKTHLENGLINFEKMQMIAQTLRTVRYCKSRAMKLDASACKFKSSIRSIELFFRDLKIIDNQRTLTQMSHQLEHRKT